MCEIYVKSEHTDLRKKFSFLYDIQLFYIFLHG